jgi:hypothetical protein
MNVVSIVANLQKECDYYKEQCEECKQIIKQLTDGPGEFEYIHPFDVSAMLNDDTSNTYIDIWKSPNQASIFTIGRSGKKYKQSVNIPAKDKRFK